MKELPVTLNWLKNLWDNKKLWLLKSRLGCCHNTTLLCLNLRPRPSPFISSSHSLTLKQTKDLRREGGWMHKRNEGRQKWVSSGGHKCLVVGCRGVKITGFNGLERPHIRTLLFQKWEFEESEGRVKERCCLKHLILLIWKRAWEIWEFLGCCFLTGIVCWNEDYRRQSQCNG